MSKKHNLKLMMVAAELSGDQHGAALLREVKKIRQCEAFGVGGPNMVSEGFRTIRSFERLQHLGIAGFIKNIFYVYALFKELAQLCAEQEPDAIVLIDYPFFNLRLARHLRRLGIPIIHYSAPQVWASRPGRVKKLSYTDCLIVLLPFEEEIFTTKGINAKFFGHPLVDAAQDTQKYDQLCAKLRQLNWNFNAPCVVIAPGSRALWLKLNLPAYLGMAKLLKSKVPDIQFILPLAASLDCNFVEQSIIASGLNRDCLYISDDLSASLDLATIGVINFGTATMQTMLKGVPFFSTTRGSRLDYIVWRIVYRSFKTLNMANILWRYRHNIPIADDKQFLIKELIQNECTAENMAKHALQLLDDQQLYQQLKTGLLECTQTLGKGGAYTKAAELIINYAEGR